MGAVIDFEQKKEPVCAFCKRPKSKVPILVSAVGLPAICSDCVEKCKKIIAAHDEIGVV